MMQAALETPEMRQQLIAVLSLAPADRKTTIRQWLGDLKVQGAPSMLITAISYLEDHQRAEKALEILTQNQQ